MTRLQDHNSPQLWNGKPSPWATDTNLPETLQRRLTSIVIAPPTDAEARDAALVVCGHAMDAADARQLLAMCGLLEARDG